MSGKLQVSLGQFSDRGVKAGNEDFFGVLVPEEPILTSKGIAAVIADGMSSSAAPALASEYCVKGFFNDYFSTPESWTVKKSGEKVLSALNRWLYGQGQSYQGSGRGLVTTFSALIIKSTTAHLFHIGDTRIYQLRDGYLEPLTQDHHIWVAAEKHYLNRAMGIDLYLEIDYRSLPVEPGDIYLFTTDGVHEYVRERDMRRLIAEELPNLQRAAGRIVAAARARHSPDNLSCQLLRIDALPPQDVDSVYQQLTELPFPPVLESGMVLDGYRILRELYASPTSQLYLALDQEIHRQVVIKTPSVNYEDDPAYIERFLHEEWAGRRIHSPYVLKVYETTRRRRFLYYVMEYLEGQTLRQWMRDHPRPSLQEARVLIGQIAQGLRAFHRLDMLHRDLKPENIFIDRFGAVKIIDFGSVKIAGINEICTPIERTNLLGTRNYIAPEYLLGDAGSSRSDLYSLGVISYELLTSELPYGGGMPRHPTLRQLRRLDYVSARRHRRELPEWLDGALEKAVSPDPTRRYAVLSEFLHDLSYPNAAFLKRGSKPLMERDPLRFWQTVAVVLVLVNLLLVYWLTR